MGYIGNTLRIPLDIGGFTANPNTDIIPLTSIIGGKNINFHQGGKRKRKGTAKVNGTAVSGAPQLVGLIDYILYDATQFQVFATNDGKIYKNSTTTIKTGLTADKVSNFVIWADTLYHTNKQDTIQTWNGVAASTSDLTNPATDWGAGDQPTQLIVHGSKNSERLWACGSPGQPRRIYASANGSANFVTGVITFNIETGDGAGIVGMRELQDKLICFGKNRAFIIDDSSTDTANWDYDKAAWTGGAAHHRVTCNTDNDIIVMSEDMDIYSIRAVQETGDYKAASIARPAFIDQWIKDNCKVAQIAKFHMIYDTIRRAVLLFLVSNSSATNEVDICLPFYIDRPIETAWGVPFDNATYACGYDASCAAMVKKSAGVYAVYTGDYDGFIWELETTLSDDSNAFYNGLILPYVSAENIRVNKTWDNLWLVVIPYADTTLSVRVWVDGHLIVGEDNLVTEAGDFILTEDGYYLVTEQEQLWNLTFSTNVDLLEDMNVLGEEGKRIKIEIFNESATSDYLLSQVLFDFRDLGAQPK